jgi:hypothetical protein
MRRRLSLVLLAVVVVVAIVTSARYMSPEGKAARRAAALGVSVDSLARLDSARRADFHQEADTMCFAARIGLPCDPR